MRCDFIIKPGKHVFSDCRKYRYVLWREVNLKYSSSWQPPENYLLFIGLNPSMADEKLNDPTITRLMGRARRAGYQRLCVVNLFAFRATYPEELIREPLPWGIDNLHWIIQAARGAHSIFAGWGARGGFKGQDTIVCSYLEHLVKKPVWCWAITKEGQPGHPLYLPNNSGIYPFIQ